MFQPVPPVGRVGARLGTAPGLGLPGSCRWKALSNCGFSWVSRPTRNPKHGLAPDSHPLVVTVKCNTVMSPRAQVGTRASPALGRYGVGELVAGDCKKETRGAAGFLGGRGGSPDLMPRQCLVASNGEHRVGHKGSCRLRHAAQEKPFPLEPHGHTALAHGHSQKSGSTV